MADSASRPPRILFVGEAISLAHVVRPLELTSSLDPSRYDAHFACDARYRPLVESAGLPVHELPTIDSAAFFGRIARGKPVYTVAELREYVRVDLALIARVNPDLVVGDFRLSLSTSCELAGVLYAPLVNAHWSPYSTLKFPVPDIPITRLLGERLSGIVMPVALPRAFRSLARPHNRIRREFGLEPLGNLREVYTRGNWTLYPDAPELSPTANLPANHRYIGPVLWEPDIEMPRWKRFMDPDRKRAYVTMGSSGDQSIIRRVVEALLSLDCEVLVTANPASLPCDMSEGVFAAPMLPGLQAAAMCDIVVCHGGSGTVYQALSQGKPVLGICSNPDQQLVMNGVEHAGAGQALVARRANARSIRKAATQLLAGDSFRLSAELSSMEIGRCDATQRFGECVAEFLGAGRVASKPSGIPVGG